VVAPLEIREEPHQPAMSMDFWTLIAHTKDRKDCLAAWQQIVGGHFEALRPLLAPCPGEYSRTYPDPQTGGLLSLSRFEDRWAAFRDGEWGDDSDDLELTEADVLLYRLDGDAHREGLRVALGIQGPSSVVGPRLECLGICTQGPKRRRVYWCQARDEGESLAGAHEVITRAGIEGCACIPMLGESVDRMLAAAGVSGVSLAGNLSLTAGKVEGGCGIACRHMAPKDLSVRDLKGHLDGRLDNLGERVVALNQENESLKQNLARVLTEFARRVDPEFLGWVFVILAAGSVRGGAKALKMPKSTLDDRLKQYADRGGVYRLLHSALDIRRKGVGQGEVESFNELFLRHQPQNRPPGPDVWRELLDGLEALNSENWREVRAELVDLLLAENPDI
jgi:hypothetical protein